MPTQPQQPGAVAKWPVAAGYFSFFPPKEEAAAQLLRQTSVPHSQARAYSRGRTVCVAKVIPLSPSVARDACPYNFTGDFTLTSGSRMHLLICFLMELPVESRGKDNSQYQSRINHTMGFNLMLDFRPSSLVLSLNQVLVLQSWFREPCLRKPQTLRKYPIIFQSCACYQS